MFENYKNCLEVTQVENKIKYLEENKIDIDNIKENYKEFTKKKKKERKKKSVLKKYSKGLKVKDTLLLLKKLTKDCFKFKKL